jgi:hypothetical protein
MAIGLLLGAIVGLPIQTFLSANNYGRAWLTVILAGGFAGLTYHLGYKAADKDADRRRKFEARAHVEFLDSIDRLKQHLRQVHDKTDRWINANEAELPAAHQTEHREGRTHYQLHEDLP